MTYYPDSRPFEGVTNWLLVSVLSLGPISLLLVIASFAIYPTMSSRTYFAALAALALVVGFAGRNARFLADAGWRKLTGGAVLSCALAGGLSAAILIPSGPALGSKAYADGVRQRNMAAGDAADQLAFYQARRICFAAVRGQARVTFEAEQEGASKAAALYRAGTNKEVISVSGQTSLITPLGATVRNAFACDVAGGEVVKIALVPETDRRPGDALALKPVR